MDSRLPGDGVRQGQAGGFEGMARGFMGRLRGPWGCVFALLACTCLLPVVIVLFIFNFAKLRAMWKAQREAERGTPRPPFGGGFGGGAPGTPGAAGPRAGPGAQDAFAQALSARAAAMLVRAMVIDESFTREEALQAGVAAGAGMSPAEILDDAMRRGWIAERGDGRLHVTDRGRAEAERL